MNQKTVAKWKKRTSVAYIPTGPKHPMSSFIAPNGAHFTTPGTGGSAAPLIADALAKRESVCTYAFEYACAQLGIHIAPPSPSIPGRTARSSE